MKKAAMGIKEMVQRKISKPTISIHFTVAWNSLTPPGDFSAARNADLHMFEPGAECSW